MNLLDAPESRKLFGLENSGENEIYKQWDIIGILWAYYMINQSGMPI